MKKFLEKNEKVLDKLKKLWYNTYIIKGEDTERPDVTENEVEEKDV